MKKVKLGKAVRYWTLNQDKLDEATKALFGYFIELASDKVILSVAKKFNARLMEAKARQKSQ